MTIPELKPIPWEWDCLECGKQYVGPVTPWYLVGGGFTKCNYCGGNLKQRPRKERPQEPLYKMIVVANTSFRGANMEEAKRNFMNAAETLSEDEWTFILVEEEQL